VELVAVFVDGTDDAFSGLNFFALVVTRGTKHFDFFIGSLNVVEHECFDIQYFKKHVVFETFVVLKSKSFSKLCLFVQLSGINVILVKKPL